MYTQALTKNHLLSLKRRLRKFTDNASERRAFNRVVLQGGAGLNIIAAKKENDGTNKHYTFTIVNDKDTVTFTWNICNEPIATIFREFKYYASQEHPEFHRLLEKETELTSMLTDKLKELQTKHPIVEQKVGRFTITCVNKCKA